MTNNKSDILNVAKEQNEDKDEKAILEIAKARYSNFIEENRQSILKADGGITSDEKLVSISSKKEIILDKFLELFKSSAVDCKFNYAENIRSDSSFKDLECYDSPISNDDEFIYPIDIAKLSEPASILGFICSNKTSFYQK